MGLALQGLALQGLGSGGFVVVWRSDGSSGTDDHGLSIQAQRYHGDGSPNGEEFQVNTSTSGNQFAHSVSLDGSGGFVVTWESYSSTGNDTDRSSIHARRYFRNGLPNGDQFQVNTYTTSFQVEIGVSADGSGGFVVTWFSNGSSGTDTDLASIQARHFAGVIFRDGFESGDTSEWAVVVP